MPGPIGNQHALGNSGRPSQYDLKHIASEMLAWSKSPNALKLTMFTREYWIKHDVMLNLQRFPEWAAKDDEFADAYKFTKQNMDVNRFQAANEDRMPEDWYKARETVYCPTTYHHEEKTKDRESDRRVKQSNAQKDADSEAQKRIMASIEEQKLKNIKQ